MAAKRERAAYSRAWREAHKEQIRMKAREYRLKNREYLRAYHTAWTAKNRERVRAYQTPEKKGRANAQRKHRYQHDRDYQQSCKERSRCYRENMTAEQRAHDRAYHRQWSKTPAGKLSRRREELRRFGITEAIFESLLKRQQGLCGICKQIPKPYRSPSTVKWCVDHDHRTGYVRGLLCHQCNSGIGLLGDTEAALLRALIYLRNPTSVGQFAAKRVTQHKPEKPQ